MATVSRPNAMPPPASGHGYAAAATGSRRHALHAVALQQHRLRELGIRETRRRPPQAPGGVATRSPTPELTLAQRMGLVDAPEPPLTDSEWDHVRSQALSQEPRKCPICQDPFHTAGDEVLLSCAHVFHHRCLRSWERHARRRSCPCCRKEHYQKRESTDATSHHRSHCARVVQAAWRGRRARQEYAKLYARADPSRLRAYCAERLCSLTDSLAARVEGRTTFVDRVLEDIDQSLARSRAVMRDPASQPTRETGLEEEAPPGEPSAPRDMWAEVRARALGRGVRECAVCLQPCAPVGPKAPGRTARRKPVCLLSCSHVFHVHCIESFESFALPGTLLSCPECREAYTRVELSPSGEQDQGRGVRDAPTASDARTAHPGAGPDRQKRTACRGIALAKALVAQADWS